MSGMNSLVQSVIAYTMKSIDTFGLSSKVGADVSHHETRTSLDLALFPEGW